MRIDLEGPANYAVAHSHGEWRSAKHLEFMSDIIADGLRQGDARIAFFCPPGHGKSRLVSLWSNLWYHRLRPKDLIAHASYGAEYSSEWGGLCLATSREISDGPSTPLPGRGADHKWKNVSGGGMVCSGAGGVMTGRRPNLVDVDDPVKNWDEAYSAAVQKSNNRWMDSVVLTRLEPHGSCLLVMTRWADADLGGYIQTLDGSNRFTVYSLPAIAEDNDPMGRKPGEALWPQRWPAEVLLGKKIHPLIWNAMYQQRPSKGEGQVFRASWFRHWESLPVRFDEVWISVDASFKALKTSDHVVIQVWGRLGHDAYLLEERRGQWGINDTEAEIKSLSARWHPNGILVEDKANGTAVIEQMQLVLPGVVGWSPTDSKISRAIACAPRVQGGQVLLPPPSRFPWVLEFIQEWVDFPGGAYDDRVDAGTQILLRWQGSTGLWGSL